MAENPEVRREKAILFKLLIFVAVFIGSVNLKNRWVSASNEYNTKFMLFGQKSEERTGIGSFLTNQLYFGNTKEFLVLIFRILLSSFIKDMLIAVCSPSIFDSPISERLIHKVENATLDQSWIPQTDRQRRLNFERKKLKAAQRKHNKSVETDEELTELSDAAIDELGHTFIYKVGHTSVERSVQLGHDTAKMAVQCIHLIQKLIESIISKCINLVVFTIRSIVCTISSVVLLILYAFQLVLRVIKIAYNFAEWILMYFCSCINDVSLLAVEVIQETSLANGEDIYVKLKASVDKLPDNKFESSMDSDDSIITDEEIMDKITTPKTITKSTSKNVTTRSFKFW